MRPPQVLVGAALVATSIAVLSAQPGPITVTIDRAVRHQPILGWGATLSFLHNLNYTSATTLQQVVADAVEDLGLTFLRVRDGVLSEPLNDDDDPNHINWAGFRDSAAVDREVAQGLAHFVAVARNAGIEPTLIFVHDEPTPVPLWMTPAEAAEHITANLLYYKDVHNIAFAFVSIDNEPATDVQALPRQRAIIEALGPRLLAAGLTTRIALNEGRDGQAAYTGISALIDDPAVRPHVGLLSWHLYGTNDPFRALLSDIGGSRAVPTGMTEFIGAGIAELADDLVEGGVSFWSGGLLADRGGPETGRGLFSVQPAGASYSRGPAYFPLRHVMRSVRPNAVRLGTTSPEPGVRVLAFDQAGGSTVVVANTTGRRFGVRVVGLAPQLLSWAGTLGGTHVEGHTSSTPVLVLDPGDIVTLFPRVNEFSTPTVPLRWSASPPFLTQPASTVQLSAAAGGIFCCFEFAIMTYDWKLLSAPPGAPVVVDHPRTECCNMSDLSDAAASGLTVPGTYVFTVTSHIRSWAGGGSLSAPSSRDVTVRVYPGNQPPVIAEGHRFFKEEWLILPESSQTYGTDFISAFDLEGEPVTTAFSVVRQPLGANARFNGATVSGMTVAGEYTFRFTVSDGTRTATREFTRLVVGGVPVKGERGSGAERRPRWPEPRRPPAAGATSTAVAEVAPPAATRQPAVTQPVEAVAVRLSREAAERLGQILDDLVALGLLEAGLQVIELHDTDTNGWLDRVEVRLVNGDVWSFPLEQAG
jgi:hypothetical protein